MTHPFIAFCLLGILGSCTLPHGVKYPSPPKEDAPFESTSTPMEEVKKKSPFVNVEFAEREASSL